MVSFKKKITVLETELVCLLELIFKGKFVLEELKNYPYSYDFFVILTLVSGIILKGLLSGYFQV